MQGLQTVPIMICDLHCTTDSPQHCTCMPYRTCFEGTASAFSSDCRTMCDRDPAAGKLGGALEEMPALIEAIIEATITRSLTFYEATLQ